MHLPGVLLLLEVARDHRILVQLDEHIDRPETDLFSLIANPHMGEDVSSTQYEILALEDEYAVDPENSVELLERKLIQMPQLLESLDG